MAAKDKKKKKNVKKKAPQITSEKETHGDNYEILASALPKSQPNISTPSRPDHLVTPSIHLMPNSNHAILQNGKSQLYQSKHQKPGETKSRNFPAIKIETQLKIDIRNDLAGKIKDMHNNTIQSSEKKKDPSFANPTEPRKLKTRSRCISLDCKTTRSAIKKRSLDCLEAKGELASPCRTKSNERRKIQLDFEAQNAKLKVG